MRGRPAERLNWDGSMLFWDAVIMDRLGPVSAAIIERLHIAEDHQRPALIGMLARVGR